MKVKPSLLAAMAAMTVGGAVFFGANSVSAQTTGESLVERIASRFSLDQTEVQAVFDEVKDEHQADRAAQLSEKLQEKVDDGTITAEQKTLIEEKIVEQQAVREELRDQDLTREEMREQMQSNREALEQWAEDNGISAEDLFPLHEDGQRNGGPRGFGGPKGL